MNFLSGNYLLIYIRMNDTTLTKVALRYRALFLNVDRSEIDMRSVVSAPLLAFLVRLRENGYCVSEELLHALSGVSSERMAAITECIDEVMGVHLNWAPLVKGWTQPTGERAVDHLITLFANLLGEKSGVEGTTLPCGHLIPDGTFPLERYNGCPFCGTPFETANHVYKDQASKLKELRLYTLSDMRHLFYTLLTSATPLDGTQKDSLEQLLGVFPIPEGTDIAMKETAMLVIKKLVQSGDADKASQWLRTPSDVLRYLWYEKTGYVQVIEPRTLIAHAGRLHHHLWGPLDTSKDAAESMKEKLRLKYDRRTCLRVARWMNSLPMSAVQCAEDMNPKRGMWVRLIRALRMAEYSHKKGFEHLAGILDVFYRQDYSTWQGQVDKARVERDADHTLTLLKQRPGLFARCLFATMLRFGSDKVLAAFEEVSDQLPLRLLLSLGNAADTYFDLNQERTVRTITGVVAKIGHNRQLPFYSREERDAMSAAVNSLYTSAMSRRFAAQPTESKTIYIDPLLYSIPVSVGDRSATIQDTSCALMGTRWTVEGDAVRLFMQWGRGMHAQPLDMDLSARISLPDGKVEECAYFHLTAVGAKHSGDIQTIPEMVGTAEYIELSLPELESAGATHVTFTCNAYSTGALSPNLEVGWMSSAYPMAVSEENGVAYDPSCVQHIVRISEGDLSKGLVFGVLDVSKREIIWLEMPFTSQTIKGADSASVMALLHRLEKKLSIGQLLEIKAVAQHLEKVETKEAADETFTYEWALNPAEVTQLLSADNRSRKKV